MKEETRFITVPELAKIMGLSRSQAFRKVKAGLIPSQRVGRIYLIDKKFVASLPKKISKDSEEEIIKAVKRVIKEYGEVIKMLGDE